MQASGRAHHALFKLIELRRLRLLPLPLETEKHQGIKEDEKRRKGRVREIISMIRQRPDQSQLDRMKKNGMEWNGMEREEEEWQKPRNENNRPVIVTSSVLF